MARYRGRHAAAKYTGYSGGRLRRGVSTAAVAAAAMAALTASQAPGIDLVNPSGDEDGGRGGAPQDGAPGDDAYYTELPPLESPQPEGEDPGDAGPAESGIPATVLAAYKKAERSLAGSDPGCALPWELLAAIGKVESGQARGGAVDADGTTLNPILGPVLNGQGFARITDTDRGVHDGDTRFDRAVGPMQFIPSTWATWGADGNGDGRSDPNNIFDAALAAGEYLCAGERNLAVKADLDAAILSYNHSREYLRTVLAWLEFYRKGVHQVPDGEGVPPSSPVGGGENGRRGGQDGNDGRKPSGNDGKKPSGEQGGEGGDKPGGDPGPDPQRPDDGPPGEQDPTPEPDPTTPTPDPDPVTPAELAPVGSSEVTATVGGEFADPLRTRVTTESGTPVRGVEVRYTVVGEETEARFPDSARQATVTSDRNGIATAPKLHAGGKAGTFTVRATVVGRGLSPAEFTATVEPAPAPKADELTRVSGTEQRAAAGDAFAERIEVRAEYQGRTAAGAAVDAALLTKDGKPLPEGEGPFFKNADGERARILEGLKTDQDGRLTVPEVFAGGKPGTYRLLLTTADGGELAVELVVTEPEPA